MVRVLIESDANVEEHNENGHTPLMEASSAGHVNVAHILLEAGACINTHSNEFKESALTLACYKGKFSARGIRLRVGAACTDDAKFAAKLFRNLFTSNYVESEFTMTQVEDSRIAISTGCFSAVAAAL